MIIRLGQDHLSHFQSRRSDALAITFTPRRSHMGHKDQDGEKVGQMSRSEKSKNSYTFKSYYLILAVAV